ncbi:MAG: response regulator [Chthoniobacteraceae bacterium]
MLDNDEIRWMKSTANELNNLLLVINESARFLEDLCNPVPENRKYFAMLRDGVERAAQVTQGMRKRIGEYEQGGLGRNVLDGNHATPLVGPDVPPENREATSPDKLRTSFKELDITNPDGSKELILIVDDDNSVIFLTKRILADEGYRVISACDGHECLKIYKRLRQKIALVILDFEMPIMHGSEVFIQLRFMNPHICVVASSGIVEQEQMREMLAKGLRGFIPKPFTAQKFLLQVRSVLDSTKGAGLPYC